MTSQEMIYQLWENAGEPSDLDPWIDDPLTWDAETELNPNSRGVRHFIKLMSDAQIMLSNWKTTGNRPIRFKSFQVQRNAKLTLDDRTYAAVVGNNNAYLDITTDPFPAWMADSTVESSKCELTVTHYNDQVEPLNQAEIDQAIIDGDPIPAAEYPLVATVYEQMVMFPEVTGTTLRLYFREENDMPSYIDSSTGVKTYFTLESSDVTFYFDRFAIHRTGVARDTAYLAMPTSFRNLLKVTDADNSAPLSRAGNKESLYNPNMNTGTPTQWFVLGDKIYFDVYFEEPRWFNIEYQKLPERLVILNGIIPQLEIPDQWHDVLIEMVEYGLAKRAQENELVAVKFGNINKLISRLRTDEQENNLRDDLGGWKIDFSS
jgi:hypothetical protein